MNYQPTAAELIASIRRQFIAARIERAKRDAETRQGIARQAAEALVAYWERQARH